MSETTTTTMAANASNAASSSKSTAASASSRPIHPAYITNFGPGRGSGSSELCCYAYLTSPRPRPKRRHASNTTTTTAAGAAEEQGEEEYHLLPNLVTAQSNSLRVYTILPHAGTLALSAIYDNLAGTIISLDVIPHGTTTTSVTGGSKQSVTHDGLLLGFAGLPRLSLVYPSTSGIGGVLLASSIIDFSTTIKEYSYGGLSYSEIDMIVTVLSRSSQQQQQQQHVYNVHQDNIVEDEEADDEEDDDPPRISVVLGGGVAIATFSLLRVSRPLEEDDTVDDCVSSNSSWWRVASEPYILPLATLSAKIRDETITTTAAATSSTNNNTEKDKRENKGNLLSTGVLSSVTTTASHTLGHGFGDIIDIAYLSGYTEPTLLILHTNPRKGGGRAWSGRLGRTAEVVTTTTATATPSNNVDEYGDDIDMDTDDDDDDDGRGEEKQNKTTAKKVTTYTGTKYGLTLTAISISMHQRRSVILWSLVDALPVDAWKLIPQPATSTTSNGSSDGGGGGVLVYGTNTIVYVSMGGKVQCALAVNGFACIGCPTGLLPPPYVVDTYDSGDNQHVDYEEVGVYLKPNPSPLPRLALQLDASSRISFVTDTIALVCCGNGTLHSLELHHCQSKMKNGGGGRNNEGEIGGMFMSLFPLGYRVGGLGSVTSCLSVLNATHSRSMKRYLGEERVNNETEGDVNVDSKRTAKTEDEAATTNDDDYSNMTVTQLKELLRSKGLKLTGKKIELIELLVSSSSPTVKEDPTRGNDKERLSSSDSPTSKIQVRGLVFVGSRMGDCSLFAFSLNEPTQLVPKDPADEYEVDDDDFTKNTGGKRKPEAKMMPNALTSIISGGGPMRKHPRRSDAPTIKVDNSDDEKNNVDDHTHENGTGTLTEEEILRLEEEELYRDDDDDAVDGAPTIISSYHEDGDSLDDDDDDNNDYASARPNYDDTFMIPSRRHADHRLARRLSMFGSIRALDSLTGLGPLGGGCHGPVATCPSLTTGEDDAIVASSTSEAQHESLFSNAFSSAARHYIMPCGFGESGGLAILTTPGRDVVGGSVLCESDLCNMAGPIFGLPRSNLVLMGKANGEGSIVLRGILRVDDDQETFVEEFGEIEVDSKVSMNEVGDTPPSFKDAVGIFRQMTLFAATEFSLGTNMFSVFFVRDPREDCINPYAIIVMSDVRQELSSDFGLTVDFVHRIDIDESNKPFFNNDVSRGQLTSITPMISKISDDGSSILSITFGCVWTSGNASVFNIIVNNQTTIKKKSVSGFKLFESIIVGDHVDNDNYYDSNKVVALDVISLPNHIFDMPTKHTDADHEDVPVNKSSVAAIPESSSSLSFSPDRLSMHGTWSVRLGSLQTPTMPYNRIAVAICRRSGLLQIFDSEELSASTVVDCQSVTPGASSLWQANGCSHGSAILGIGESVRCPEHHEVEVAELRLFITGPSLQPDSISGNMSFIDEEKDSWMLRSLCILVDTTQGDLHLYSGSKRSSKIGLEFSRVPLANVSRPSDEAGRHLIKLRRRGIVPQQLVKPSFRANRLHRFSGISGEDGLFAATPRPLWFVSERGAPTVVSHKSRHVSPAGCRPVPVSGFCTQMPAVFQNARNGYITIHERIGRIGSQRLTLYNGLWDVFAPHGLIPGGGMSIQKVPLGVTVRHIEFIDDASISTTSRPVYALLVSHEFEGDQSYLVNDGLSPEERQIIKDEKEAAMVRKQVEADLGGFDIEQEWVEEIEREECFTIDQRLGLAPPIPTRRFELWIVDASAQFKVMDKYQLDEFEHATAMKVMFLTDVVEDSDEIPEVNLFIGVGTSEIDQDGEDLASKGRILLFQVKKSKKKSLSKGYKTTPLQLALKSEKEMALGPVTSLSSLKTEDKYRMVVGAGAEVTVEQWGGGKLTQVGFYHAHMQVQDIVLFKTFFLLSDAYDSLHFLVWRESDKSLTLLAKDYEPNNVFASGLISRGGAMAFVCHDDRQNLSFLQYAPTDAAARGGNKLVSRADFHIGTQTTSLRSHWGQSSLMFNSCTTNSTLAALKQQDSMFEKYDQRFAINFGTSDGSFCSIVPLSEPTYWRLTALQSVMSNALESNCALSHIAWRLYRRSTRRAGCRNNDRMKGVIDGDVVMKFVDLPLPDQEDLASSIGSTVGLVMDNLLELACASSVV